jgi:hypothetical protein
MTEQRVTDARWAEGYYCGFVVGLVVMGVGAIGGAVVALWWLAV